MLFYAVVLDLTNTCYPWGYAAGMAKKGTQKCVSLCINSKSSTIPQKANFNWHCKFCIRATTPRIADFHKTDISFVTSHTLKGFVSAKWRDEAKTAWG